MSVFQDIIIFNRQLQMLQEEYNIAPVHVKSDILQDIQLLQKALALLQSDAS